MQQLLNNDLGPGESPVISAGPPRIVECMRSPDEIAEALRLIDMGLDSRAISRRVGVPDSTIRGWRRGFLPRVATERGGVGCPRCGWPEHEFDALSEAAYAYLLGLYLGDGHIARIGRVHVLRIYLDRSYPGIVHGCAEAMQQVVPLNKVSVYHDPTAFMDRVQSYSKQWTCLIPQHGPGLKHLRRIELTDWQRAITHRHPEPLLRGLIHSDGCRGTNTIKHPKKTYRYPRYQFSNRSDDVKGIFCEHLDLVGVDWRVMNRWTISVARRESVALLDEFIGPKA
jgi:hypothetical protein